jgi:hypothetical protein
MQADHGALQQELSLAKEALEQARQRSKDTSAQLVAGAAASVEAANEHQTQLAEAKGERESARKAIAGLEFREGELSRRLAAALMEGSASSLHPAIEAVKVLDGFHPFQQEEYKEHAEQLAAAFTLSANELLLLRDSVRRAIADQSDAVALLETDVSKVREFILRYAPRFELAGNGPCQEALAWARGDQSREERLEEASDHLEGTEAPSSHILLQRALGAAAGSLEVVTSMETLRAVGHKHVEQCYQGAL